MHFLITSILKLYIFGDNNLSYLDNLTIYNSVHKCIISSKRFNTITILNKPLHLFKLNIQTSLIPSILTSLLFTAVNYTHCPSIVNYRYM